MVRRVKRVIDKALAGEAVHGLHVEQLPCLVDGAAAAGGAVAVGA
jgi:hypothetical protein